jgi:lipopolysaccharide/colanic/teichoic acid biosynthesis glycosyltransferase
MNPPGKLFSSLGLRQVKPGLVTWAHANEDQREIVEMITNIDRCINSDCFYIENCSLLFDIKILMLILLSKTSYL